jgi:uncharacterized protein Veg
LFHTIPRLPSVTTDCCQNGSLNKYFCAFKFVFCQNGNNVIMREIGDSILFTKERVRSLKDVHVVVKVVSGRGKSSLVSGTVTAVFPSVFSVTTDNGEVKTFSYSDVHSGGVLFLNPTK